MSRSLAKHNLLGKSSVSTLAYRPPTTRPSLMKWIENILRLNKGFKMKAPWIIKKEEEHSTPR